MTDQVSTIGIGVDSRSAVAASAALDQMAASGQKSENVIQRLATAATEFAGGLRQGAVQALDEHRKQAELAASATKKLGEETTVATSKIANGMSAADGALRNFLVGAISGTAVVAAIAKEFGNFNHQIDQLAQLDDASQAIGETIEKLSGLEGVAKVTNFSFGMVTASLARLTKGLAGSDDETKGAAYALKQLGIEARDSEGKLRSAVDITKEVASVLGKAENAANKTAYAQAIYGRGAAALIPYLNDLAKANLDGAIATTQQAEAATNYRDAQGALALESTKLYNVIAGAVLPVFTQVIEGMTRAKGETGSLNSQIKLLAEDGSLARWSQNAVIGIGYVIDAARAVPVVFEAVGIALAAAAVEAVNYAKAIAGVFTVVTSTSNPQQMKEGFDQAASAIGGMGNAVKYAREDIDKLFSKFSAGSFADKLAATFGPNLSVNLRAFNNEIEKTAKVLPDFDGKAAATGKATIDVYAKLIEKIAERITVENAALEGHEKFTAGQKFALSVMKELVESKKKFTDAQKISVTKMLEELLTTEALTKAKADQKKIDDAMVALNKEAIAIEAKLIEAARAQTLAVEAENDKLKEEIATFGLSKTAINNLSIAKLEAKLLTYDLAASVGVMSDADINAADAIRKQIEALKERNGLFASKEILEDAKKTQDELTTVWKGIGEDLTNYVLSGFQNTRGLLKKMFETLVLRPIISPIMNAVAGGLQGLLGNLLGGLGGSENDASGGGAGGLLGIGASLFSGAFSGGLGTAVGVFDSVLAGTGSVLEGLTAGLSSLTGGASSFLGVLGPIGIAVGVIAAIASSLGVFTNETGIKIDNSVTDGRGRKDIIDSALGAFDVSGDIENSAFAPLIKTVNSLDSYIADHLLTQDTLDTVRANIQRISSDATDWFGFEDDAGAKVAIEKASKLFLQQRYSVAFDEIDASVAQMIRTFGGSADELIEFITKAVTAKQVIDKLNEALPKLNLSLGAYLTLTEQQQQDLATIATLMPLLGQDIAQLGADAYAAQTRGVVDSFIAQGDALDLLVDKFNTGNLSITELAAATAEFGNSAIQVIAALADARDQVDANVAAGVRNIQTTGLDPEALNAFLSNEAERLRAELAVTTDPAKIQDLVNRIIANSTQVFSGLTPEEQAARRDEFITGLQTLQNEADARIATLSNLVANNTQTELAVVKGILEEAADKIVASANTNAAAVDKFNDATDKFDHTVDKGIHVTVDLETANVGGL